MADEVKKQEKAPKKRKMMPILVANLLVVAVVAYLVNSASADQKEKPRFIPEPYYEFNLDKLGFTMPSITGKFIDDPYQIVIKLSINPEYENVGAILDDLKTRKSYIQDRIYGVLNRMTAEEILDPDFIVTFKKKVKDEINISIYKIKSSEDEIVRDVILVDRILPASVK